MSEQLGVDSSLGDCAAVDGYVFLVFARAEMVYDFREELLAAAALAVNQHGEVNGCYAHGTPHGLEQGL